MIGERDRERNVSNINNIGGELNALRSQSRGVKYQLARLERQLRGAVVDANEPGSTVGRSPKRGRNRTSTALDIIGAIGQVATDWSRQDAQSLQSQISSKRNELKRLEHGIR